MSPLTETLNQFLGTEGLDLNQIVQHLVGDGGKSTNEIENDVASVLSFLDEHL